MRFLMDEEHQYRVREFDAVAVGAEGDFSARLARILAGSEPALLRAMIEACGVDDRLREFGRGVRTETAERLAAAFARAREARAIRRPALDPTSAAWATLVMSDSKGDATASEAFQKTVAVLAFAETDAEGRAQA